MTRPLAVALAAFGPHLLEEALTRMHDDPIIVWAFSPLVALEPRHAVYLVFQCMIVALVATCYAYSLGGLPRRLVLVGFTVALLAESHHLARAALTCRYNSGLCTAPLAVLAGVLLARQLRHPSWR